MFLCFTHLHQRMISLYVWKWFINIHWPPYSMFSNIIFTSRAHFPFAPRAQQTHEEFMLKEEFHWDSDIRCHYNIFGASKVVCASVILPSAAEKVVCYHIIISVVQVFRFAICFLWAQCSLLVYRGEKMI